MSHDQSVIVVPLWLVWRIRNDDNLRVWNQIPPHMDPSLDPAPEGTLVPPCPVPLPVGRPYRQLLDEVGGFPQSEEQEGKLEGVGGGACAGMGTLVATVPVRSGVRHRRSWKHRTIWLQREGGREGEREREKESYANIDCFWRGMQFNLSTHYHEGVAVGVAMAAENYRKM